MPLLWSTVYSPGSSERGNVVLFVKDLLLMIRLRNNIVCAVFAKQTPPLSSTLVRPSQYLLSRGMPLSRFFFTGGREGGENKTTQ